MQIALHELALITEKNLNYYIAKDKMGHMEPLFIQQVKSP